MCALTTVSSYRGLFVFKTRAERTAALYLFKQTHPARSHGKKKLNFQHGIIFWHLNNWKILLHQSKLTASNVICYLYFFTA